MPVSTGYCQTPKKNLKVIKNTHFWILPWASKIYFFILYRHNKKSCLFLETRIVRFSGSLKSFRTCAAMLTICLVLKIHYVCSGLDFPPCEGHQKICIWRKVVLWLRTTIPVYSVILFRAVLNYIIWIYIFYDNTETDVCVVLAKYNFLLAIQQSQELVSPLYFGKFTLCNAQIVSSVLQQFRVFSYRQWKSEARARPSKFSKRIVLLSKILEMTSITRLLTDISRFCWLNSHCTSMWNQVKCFERIVRLSTHWPVNKWNL